MHPLAEFNVALPCAARINENMELWEIKGTLTPYEPECRRVFSIREMHRRIFRLGGICFRLLTDSER